MRALKFVMVKIDIKIVHKLLISFNLVSELLRNIPVKMGLMDLKFDQILNKIEWVFLEKSIILCISFHIKPSLITKMFPRRPITTYKAAGLTSK